MASKKSDKKNTGTTEVRESAQKIWLAGLGALSVAENEGTKLFKRLVKEGEGFEKRSRKQFEKVQGKMEDKVEDVRDAAESTWERLGASFDDKVASAVNRLGVPSRHEIQRLTRRVEELTAQVEKLAAKPKPRAKARTRKTSSK